MHVVEVVLFQGPATKILVSARIMKQWAASRDTRTIAPVRTVSSCCVDFSVTYMYEILFFEQVKDVNEIKYKFCVYRLIFNPLYRIFPDFLSSNRKMTHEQLPLLHCSKSTMVWSPIIRECFY